MDMSMDGISRYAATGRDDPQANARTTAADTQAVKSHEDNEEPSLIEVVREKGFTQFVKELEEKKKEELRQKILQAMGLSEDDLENMPAAQRAQIEEMIAREIVERTAANAQMNGSTSAVVFQQTTVKVQRSELDISATIASNMGLGPLLALQESDAVEAQNTAEQEREEDLLSG